jgi:hypothetical protein
MLPIGRNPRAKVFAPPSPRPEKPSKKLRVPARVLKPKKSAFLMLLRAFDSHRRS